jgi:hypothetical protein
VLTYRTGAAGSASGAMAMAAHLLEVTVSPTHAALAAYYEHSVGPKSADIDGFAQTVARVRPDLNPAFGRLIGLDPERTPTAQEIAHVLAGFRADGAPIPGKQLQKAARSLASELGLDPARAPTAAEVDRILVGLRADNGESIPQDRVALLRCRFLALFGIDEAGGSLEIPAALANVRAGQRGDGAPLRLSPFLDSIGAPRARIGFTDLTFAADKSVSVAWALARTEAERALILSAHRAAVASTLSEVERDLGKARKGKSGRGGSDQGHIGWITFEHFTARPTVEIAAVNPTTGEAYTELATVRTAGDPHLHSHVAVPHCVLVDALEPVSRGRVGSLDLSRLQGRVHELGGLYQAYIASNLRALGVDVALDAATGAARISAVPDRVRAAFSKRTMKGEVAARAYAEAAGLDWDSLDAARRIGLLKTGTQGDPRAAKRDDLGDFEHWRAEAQALDWRPERFVNLDAPSTPMEPLERLAAAYHAAMPFLERELLGRAVLDGAVLRVAAVRGLVAAGIESATDVDDVVKMFATRGAIQDGRQTTLLPNIVRDRFGRETTRFTTALHATREEQVIALARLAAADRSAALTIEEINAASAASPLDFATDHGRLQKAAMTALGTGGRLGLVIGVAGAGKSAMLAPLAACWRGQGRAVYGTAVAWRQAQDLTGADIPGENCFALAALLARARAGALSLNASTVVVIDEISLVSTRQLLEILEIRAKFNFTLIGIGDPMQAQSVEAGGVIDLLRRAVAPDAIPSIEKSVRQIAASERRLAGLFRDGRAGEALDFLRESGRARLAPGSYDDAVDATARLWQERMHANRADPTFSVIVMAPTNADARAISAAIRVLRRASGDLGDDRVCIDAADQSGRFFELPLAIGDRVRLFDRVNASGTGGRGLLGVNGSVLTVEGIGADGLVLRNAAGRAGLVRWDTIRETETKRIRLTYGDCATIDASQGATATEAILAAPAGVGGMDAGRAYVAASRHRRSFAVVIGEAAIRRDVAARRSLGDIRPINAGDLWAVVAARLSSREDRSGAAAFLERAHAGRLDAVDAFQTSLARIEDRESRRMSRMALRSTMIHRKLLPLLRRVAEILDFWKRSLGVVVEHLRETRSWSKASHAGHGRRRSAGRAPPRR